MTRRQIGKTTYVVWNGHRLVKLRDHRRALAAWVAGEYVATTERWANDLARESIVVRVGRRRTVRVTRDAAVWTAMTQPGSHFPRTA